MRRWTEQRWALDNVLRSVGIDWDQPRSFYLNAACGIEGGADFAAIRERVKKYADIEPAFANTARRREAKARAAEDGRLAGHRARQLFHGGDPLGLGAMVALRQRRDEPRLQQEQARLLHALRARWPITRSSR